MAAPPPVPLTQYNQVYARDADDPFNGNAAPLLAAFRPDVKTPTQLYDAATGADTSVHQAYIALIEYHGKPHYKVYHSVKKYPRHLVTTTPWDDSAFAFTGDREYSMISTVYFPPNAFEYPMIGHTNVPNSFARARDLFLQAQDDVEFLGPFADGDAQIKTVRTRNFMPLPHRYVNILLQRPKPVREGFIDLSLAMESNGDDSIEELANWMLLSITRAGANLPSTLLANELTAPVMDSSLMQHREAILHQHLPGLRAPPVGDLSAIQQSMALAINRLADETAQDRKDRHDRHEAAKTKRVSQGYPNNMDTLLRYCGCINEDELQPVWAALVNAGKHQERAVLDREFQTVALAIQRPYAAPLATGDLVNKLKSLQFAQHHADDFESGMHPFNIVMGATGYMDQGLEAIAAAARLDGEAYDTIMAGTSVSLIDAQKVKKAKIAIPITFEEGKAHLVAWAILWTTLLGHGHPFVGAIHDLLAELHGREFEYQVTIKRVDSMGQGVPGITLLLRRVQLLQQLYWSSQKANVVSPVAPNFVAILQKIQLQEFGWLPSMPRQYLRPNVVPVLDGGSTVSGLTNDTPRTGVPGAGGSPSTPGTDTTGRGGGRGGRGAGGRGSTTRQNGVTNPNKNPIFAPFEVKVQRTSINKAIRVGGPIATVTSTRTLGKT